MIKRILFPALFSASFLLAISISPAPLRAGDPASAGPAAPAADEGAGLSSPGAPVEKIEKEEPLFNEKEARDHRNAGLKWYYKKNYKKAVAEFEIAVEINPDDKEAFYYLGYAYYKEDNLEASRNAFNQAYELDSRFTPLPSQK